MKKQILALINDDKVFIPIAEEAFNTVDTDKSGFIDKDEFKNGSVLLAYKANVPIYPIYIKKREKASERFKLICGERYDINLNGKKPTEETLSEISAELKDMVIKLRDEYVK